MKKYLVGGAVRDKILGREVHDRDFVIIGAMRSGTTSLHLFLRSVPGIMMSENKELGLFLEPNDKIIEGQSNTQIRKGKSDEQLIRENFDHSKEVILGESSTFYTKAPFQGVEAPLKMYKNAPRIKLIYIIRDPWDRMFSQYQWYKENKYFPTLVDDYSFNDYLEKNMSLLFFSLYYFQIKRYLRYFNKDSIFWVGVSGLGGRDKNFPALEIIKWRHATLCVDDLCCS